MSSSVTLGVLPLCLSLAISSFASPVASNVRDWNQIPVSTDLAWTPCFDDYQCTRLQVPLDYNDASAGTAALAFIKLPAEGESDAQSLVLNNGGPGASGVNFLTSYAPALRQAFGSQYNLVSFDPRGVNNSDLVVDCFRGDTAARQSFNEKFYGQAIDASPSAAASHFSAVATYGKWCTDTLAQNTTAKYISTPAVAQDLFTFAKADAKSGEDAKLWFYAMSYGTIIGSTYATMFPDNVGRMILDGVMDMEDYYNGQWKSHVYDSDKVILSFSDFCSKAGQQACAFWGPSADNITSRIDNLSGLKSNQTSNISGGATYSDLIFAMTLSSYSPLKMFPLLAQGLAALEQGSGAAIASMGQWLAAGTDARSLISCVDAYSSSILSDLSQFDDYMSYLTTESKYLGPAMAEIAPRALCSAVKMDLKGPAFDSALPSGKGTSFPILFASNTLDPVAPIRGAKKMSQAFSNSVLLTQENVGHTVIAGASDCFLEKMKTYLGKGLPAELECGWDRVPFQNETFVAPM